MTSSRMDSDFKYRAFISYSHQDKSWADWLHKALETYRVPRRLVGQTTAAGIIPPRLLPIFRDRDELASATDLGRTVNAALAQSANLIVICSPHSASSHWVNEEVLAYKRLGRSEHIFCLIVDGEPNASDIVGRTAEECFAAALRHRLDADGALGDARSESIAADARPGKDGKTNAELKLIAGLLDVGFDSLRQRELQRRNRRMAMITAAALIMMAITTTLAVTASIARHAAVVARGDAERRQKQAEDLVGFMLGSLNDKLGEVHRLDIMQSVDDKAMAYFASLPAADATDAALTARVTALEKIGSVRMQQSQTPAALEAYQAASTLAAGLAQRSPGDMGRQAAYADALKWVGQAYWYQGDLTHAQSNFEIASALLQKAVAAKPNDIDLAFSLAMAQNNTGHVLEAHGEIGAAKTQYEAVLNIYAKLRAQQPENLRWQSFLGSAYDSLGKVALEQGHLDQAIAAYRSDQRIKATLAKRDPGNHDAQEKLLVSNAILGRALGWCGDVDAALRYTEQAVDSAKALMAFDPANTAWQEYFALYSQQLGGLSRQHSQVDTAVGVDGDAVRVLGALVGKDPTSKDLQQELAQGQLESARLQLVQGDANAAERLTQSALATVQALRVKDVGDRASTLLAAQAYTVLGQIALKRNDAVAAHGDWVRARDAIASAAQSGDDPNFLAAWAAALLLLDDLDVAKPVIVRLANAGYRAPDFVALVESKKLAYPPDAEVALRIAEAMK